jgi:hypothetical protein
MTLRKALGRILLAGLLQIAVLGGVKMTQEEIEKVMNVMHRTKVVHIMKKEGEL